MENHLLLQAYEAVSTLDDAALPVWRNALVSLDVTMTQAEALSVIGENSVSIGTISNALQITSSGATQLVETLEKKQIVSREHASSDRRVVTVKLTSNGSSIYSKLLAVRQELITNTLKDFTSEELETLITLHTKMKNNLLERKT